MLMLPPSAVAARARTRRSAWLARRQPARGSRSSSPGTTRRARARAEWTGLAESAVRSCTRCEPPESMRAGGSAYRSDLAGAEAEMQTERRLAAKGARVKEERANRDRVRGRARHRFRE